MEHLHSLWGMLFDVEKADRIRVPVTFKTAAPSGDEKNMIKNAIEKTRERKNKYSSPNHGIALSRFELL